MTQTKKLGVSGITLKKGDTLYTIVRSVSRSGMTRHISVYVIKDNKPVNISFEVAELLKWPKSNKYFAIKVSGCGMDMTFHTIYTLALHLFNDGYALNNQNI